VLGNPGGDSGLSLNADVDTSANALGPHVPGGTDPILFGSNDGTEMFHWHFDTFDLPKLPPPANTKAVFTAPI